MQSFGAETQQDTSWLGQGAKMLKGTHTHDTDRQIDLV